MDETRLKYLSKTLATLAAITDSNLLLDASTAIEVLLRDNKELKDRLWSVDRRAHAFDPWEAEDA